MTEEPTTDPYQTRLPKKDGEAYRVASPDADLSSEIRLLRAVLSSLAENIPANHRGISLVLGALVRAVSLQAKQLGGASRVERALQDAAEFVPIPSGPAL